MTSVKGHSVNLWQRFLVWLTRPPTPEEPTPLMATMLIARRAMYAEQYDEALLALEEAERLAQEQADPTRIVDLVLSRADIYIEQGRFAEAEQIILETNQRMDAARLRAPQAYTLCTQGVLAQAMGRTEEARAAYEQAIKLAHTARALGAESRAEAHLADVYLLEGNASYSIHLFRQALPKLEGLGDIELLPYFLIRLSEAMLQIGHTAEADGVLQNAHLKASQLNHRRFIRRAMLLMGSRSLEASSYSTAYQQFNEALTLYPAHLQQSVGYARTLADLALTMLRTNNALGAVNKVREGLLIAQRVDDKQLTARLNAILGMAQHRTSRLDESRTALQLASPDLPNDAFGLAAHRSLATVLASQGQYDEAIDAYQRAHRMALAARLPMEAAHTQMQLARFYEQRRDLKSALDQAQAAYALYEQENTHGRMALTSCFMGDVREQMGHGKRGLKDYEQALTRLSYIQDEGQKAAVLAMCANAYTDAGDMDSAESFFQQAIEIAKSLGESATESAYRIDYGRFLLLVNDITPAVAALLEGRMLAEPLHLPRLIALQSDRIAQCSRVLDTLEAALTLHDEALDRSAQLKDVLLEAEFQLHKGHTLHLLDRTTEAAVLLYKALYTIRSKEHPPLLTEALTLLAETEMATQPDKAAEKIQEAAALVQNSYSKRLLVGVRRVQADLYAQQGDLDKAKETWVEVESLLKMMRMPVITPQWMTTL